MNGRLHSQTAQPDCITRRPSLEVQEYAVADGPGFIHVTPGERCERTCGQIIIIIRSVCSLTFLFLSFSSARAWSRFSLLPLENKIY